MCDLIDVTLLYMSGTTVHVIIPANCKWTKRNIVAFCDVLFCVTILFFAFRRVAFTFS